MTRVHWCRKADIDEHALSSIGRASSSLGEEPLRSRTHQDAEMIPCRRRRDALYCRGEFRCCPNRPVLDDWPVTDSDGLLIDSELDRVDWRQAKAKLAVDEFDNGRSAEALKMSFERSQHVAFAWLGGELVGMARMLSDQVCNAYLLDVWTQSTVRHRGIATRMVDYLAARVPGQHIGLQTDDARAFYEQLGFRAQPEFMSRVVGEWLHNDANTTAKPFTS